MNWAVGEKKMLTKYKALLSLLHSKDINKPHEWCYPLSVSPHTSVVLEVPSAQTCPAFVHHHYHTRELEICEHTPENINRAYDSYIIISNSFQYPLLEIYIEATNYQFYQLQILISANNWMHEFLTTLHDSKVQTWTKLHHTIFF